MKKALIAMSGGVDSSMAAKLMKAEGYECIGCTMRLHGNEAVDDAKSVADTIGIPFEVCDFTEAFREKVIDHFIDAYKRGRTPNPCIECNKYLKFGMLYDKAVELGCECIVTGHYARIECSGGKYLLKKALDESKDQSYVLYSLTQEQLAHTRFPLSEMSKGQVREMAGESSFANADKPESQDICFVPDGDYVRYIEEHADGDYPPGDFVDTEGNVIGRHKGIIHYTIGQRKGLGVTFGKPMYVKSIDAENNTIALCENAELFTDTVSVSDVNWISGEVPAEPVRCQAKIRYQHKEQPAVVTPLDGGKAQIVFDEPQRAITPGQAAVFYDGDTVLGGGTIEK